MVDYIGTGDFQLHLVNPNLEIMAREKTQSFQIGVYMYVTGPSNAVTATVKATAERKYYLITVINIKTLLSLLLCAEGLQVYGLSHYVLLPLLLQLEWSLWEATLRYSAKN